MFFRSYKLVRQQDSSDCGAAALASVALHHGIGTELWRLRDLTGTDRSGTSFLELVHAARSIGLEAKGVRCAPEAIRSLPLPAVAQFHTPEGLDHFVVLFAVRGSSVVIGDPAVGVRRLDRGAFQQQWTGFLLLFARGEGANRTGEAPRPVEGIAALLRRHSGLLVEAFACGLMMTVLGLCTSLFVQHLVDSVLVRHETRLLNVLALGMLMVVLFRLLFNLVRQYLLLHVSRRIDLTLVSSYGHHLLRLPMRFFETRQAGDIISRVHDASRIREAIGTTAATALGDSILVVVASVVMWLYDARMAMLAAAFAPLIIVTAAVHHPFIRRCSQSAMERAGSLYAFLVESIAGVDTIKAHALEVRRSNGLDTRLARVVGDVFSLEKLRLSLGSISAVLVEVAGLAVLWFGGYRVMDGALTIGQLMFFYTLLGCILEPLQRLASLDTHIQEARVALKRFGEVLAVEAERVAPGGGAAFQGLSRGIELRGVGFRYGSRGAVLHGLTLEIPAGSTVAIVGESGSGKSTLLKLLMRFYDPTEGSVRADGVDLRDFEMTSLRSGIGLVSQDPFIFTGTIRENITLGEPHYSPAEIHEAVCAAGLESFVEGLPDRLETTIGERGVNLSGGQRQRLAIARILLQRPEIVIFDEATSHLDTATEQAIQKNLQTHLAGRTVIMVAHRLSTIRDADRICVLQAGTIAEQGTHEELLEQGALYAALWRAQTGVRMEPARPVTPLKGNGSNGHRPQMLEVCR